MTFPHILFILCQEQTLTEADDTNRTISTSYPVDLQFKLKSDLAEIQTWLQANKLSRNVKTTKQSIIDSHNKLANLDHQFDVKIDEQVSWR